MSKNEDRSQPNRRTALSREVPRVRRVVQLLLVLVAAVVIADALVGDQGVLAIMRARRQYDQLAASVTRQRAENARLRDQARRLREDPSAIEEAARHDLGLIRPGEKVFIVKDSPAAPKP